MLPADSALSMDPILVAMMSKANTIHDLRQSADVFFRILAKNIVSLRKSNLEGATRWDGKQREDHLVEVQEAVHCGSQIWSVCTSLQTIYSPVSIVRAAPDLPNQAWLTSHTALGSSASRPTIRA